jgi:hypothetical protein
MAPELTSEAWAQIRYDYEHTDRPVEDICAEHGISSGTLRDRMRRWNWTRRRAPIPREGPPAVTPQVEMTTPNPWPLGPRLRADERGELPQQTKVPLIPFATLPLAGGGSAGAVPHSQGESPAALPHATTEAETSAPAASDPASIAPRLQSAVARVLPAIEATLAKLAAGPQRPREMEQTARTLGALMRTLRELNALLSQHPLRSASEYDDIPEDIDEFRERLARRIEAFMESRSDEEFDEDPPSDATPAGS